MEFVTESKEDDTNECSSTNLEDQQQCTSSQTLLTDQDCPSSTFDWTLQEIWSSQQPNETDETSSSSSQSPEPSLNDTPKPDSASPIEVIVSFEIDDEDNTKRTCLICGDVSSGFHYGVSSCEACKAFFKRTIQGNIDYTCPGSNTCEINKRKRKACQACRYKKCLKSGMLKEGVRLDRLRGGRQKYRRRMEHPYITNHQSKPFELTLNDNKILTKLTLHEPETVLASPDSSVQDNKYKSLKILSELFEQQALGIIKWYKNIPGITHLSIKDQMGQLQGSWSEVLIMSLVYHSLPTTVDKGSNNGRTSLKWRLKFAPDFAMDESMAVESGLEDFYVLCCHLLDRTDRLGLRKEECILLKAIIVSNCDVALEDVMASRKLQDDLLASLSDCVAVIR